MHSRVDKQKCWFKLRRTFPLLITTNAKIKKCIDPLLDVIHFSTHIWIFFLLLERLYTNEFQILKKKYIERTCLRLLRAVDDLFEMKNTFSFGKCILKNICKHSFFYNSFIALFISLDTEPTHDTGYLLFDRLINIINVAIMRLTFAKIKNVRNASRLTISQRTAAFLSCCKFKGNRHRKQRPKRYDYL